MLRAVHGVGRVVAGEDAGLLLLGRALLGLLLARSCRTYSCTSALRDPLDERVLGREHEEGRAVQRVRPRREDGDVGVELLDAEDDLGALAPADPVALDRLRALGPVAARRQVEAEQLVGVGGDLEEPLLEVAQLDQRAAALAVAVDHVLVRDHGLVVRAPVHRRRLAVGEPALEEASGTATASTGRTRARARRPRDPSRSPSRAASSALRISTMLRSTISRGWPPSLIAAFSAGRPKESQPIGRSTVQPLRRRKCVRTSPIV